MNVKSAVREGAKLTAVVEVDREKFEEGLNKAYMKNRKYINVPGFRKGKAPRKMIEAIYGAEIFYSDAVEEIFPDVYKEAVLDQGWETVGQPSVTDMQTGEDKSVTLTIESDLYPEVTLGDYKGLEIPKAEVTVTDEEVEKELDRKADDVARVITVERPAKEGDTVVIDYEGFESGVPFEGGKGEEYELKLGSHTFIPGFEDQLIGAAAGDEKELNVTFPADYHAENLAGKPVVFKVKVHEVKETQVPEKDDEFAKDVSEFDTLEELKADIRANLLKERQESADRAFENAVIEKATENMTAEIPDVMVDEEVETEMQRFDYQLRSQGMSLEQYSKMLGGDLSGFKASIRPSALNQVRGRVMLKAVAAAEKIEATAEELEEEYKKMAESYGMEIEKIKQAVAEDDVKDDIAVRKAAKFLAENAVATAPVEEAKEEE